MWPTGELCFTERLTAKVLVHLLLACMTVDRLMAGRVEIR